MASGLLAKKIQLKMIAKKIKVFFLAGQSNMDGRARAFKLSENEKERLKKAGGNVTLYYNFQAPVPLQVTTPNEFILENLSSLIKGVRSEFSTPHLPFIIFQVGSRKVVQAMKNITNNHPDVLLIPQSANKESKDYYKKNSAPLGHYTCESMIKIGKIFFKYYQNNFTKTKK